MPQIMQYQAKSIIYFEGDVSEKIYILQSGKICLNFNDIETGQEIREMVKTGEFFGVKSAMGRYPREETVDVLTASNVMVFSVSEFENLFQTNIRICMQMLKVFSNQLRRIHRNVRNLLAYEDQTDPEKGLFNIGEYYYNNKKYKQALYAFRRYLTYYPTGFFQSQATQYIGRTERFIQGMPVEERESVTDKKVQKTVRKTEKEDSRIFFEGMNFFSQEDYENALQAFKKIVTAYQTGEVYPKALLETGRCFFYLKQYDNCIKHFTALIQKMPKHPDIVDALLYLGLSCEAKGNNQKASSFFKKILTMGDENSQTIRKAKQALKRIEGNG